MGDPGDNAASDVQVSDRLQPISVSSRYENGYRSVISVRDVAPFWLDEPKDLGGGNLGPTPLESVLGSLCGCTAMIVHIMKREMGFELENLLLLGSLVVSAAHRREESRGTHTRLDFPERDDARQRGSYRWQRDQEPQFESLETRPCG